MSKGLIEVYKVTQNKDHLESALLLLFYFDNPTTSLTINQEVIDHYPSELKQLIANNMDTIFMSHRGMNIPLIIACCQQNILEDHLIKQIRIKMCLSSMHRPSWVVASFINSFTNVADVWMEVVNLVDTAQLVQLAKVIGHSRPLFKALKLLYVIRLSSHSHYKHKHTLKHSGRHDHEYEDQLKQFRLFKIQSIIHQTLQDRKQHTLKIHHEVICPTLPQLIINKIVELSLINIPKLSPEWVSDLARVSTHFHKACSLLLTHIPMPSISIQSALEYIGSKFCLFKDTPLHLNALEIVRIPDKHIARCIDRLEHLTLPFSSESLNLESRISSIMFIHIKAPHLKHITIFEHYCCEDWPEAKTIRENCEFKPSDDEDDDERPRHAYVAYKKHLDYFWVNEPSIDYYEQFFKFFFKKYVKHNPEVESLEYKTSSMSIPFRDIITQRHIKLKHHLLLYKLDLTTFDLPSTDMATINKVHLLMSISFEGIHLIPNASEVTLYDYDPTKDKFNQITEHTHLPSIRPVSTESLLSFHIVQPPSHQYRSQSLIMANY
ncbi:hypothetical protein SAMD00019534_013780 [Acytostelium subglobosum LB1]|uniref:hypothetical protein n=1 Tax=Acytostelium subglobosum LB1 TaxID=1410327 RepID=UPI000644F097|nr:hypothetical protein SAMD00019534_013780 [Acytostelium subglobosum LB1]GAM18203.1 hypothetical protein SAMD00019534_013780 [Acytostelium subglobosum LB1]|eukprot:XP_012758799.1 hypothetical protein SAMD00019534_013780 [Acytostelium subglobosum LB1]